VGFDWGCRAAGLKYISLIVDNQLIIGQWIDDSNSFSPVFASYLLHSLFDL